MTTKKRRKRRRLRLKSSVKRFLIYFLFFLSVGIYAFKESLKIVEEFEYRETYEYKIMEKGYSLDEAKILIEHLPDEELDNILNNKYDENIAKIVSQKYFLLKNYKKYLEYKEYHEKTSYEDTIALVNVHANAGWYNETFASQTDNEYLIIVNKFYQLDKNFKRDDIQNISLSYSYANNKASSVVIDAFVKLKDEVEEKLGVHLMVNSSYRSYNDQEEIYNDFKTVSLKYADSYAARPGHSEHQTALAIDITSLEHKQAKEFTESDEYAWLKNNCHRFGFILRYPEGKEYITGYSNESWHFRYVGIEAATTIHNEDITFDEYYAYYVEK